MLSTVFEVKAQTISGVIRDENNHPIPFASLFIRQLETGTPANDEGYYTINLNEGNYHLVFSSVGYKSETFEVTISGVNPVIFDVTLHSSQTELNEVFIKSSRRDPAYEIIQNVISHKTIQDFTPTNTKTKLYFKATEEVISKSKPSSLIIESSGESLPFDESAGQNKSSDSIPDINMLEMSMIIHRGEHNEFKEERTAVKKYGTQEGLFIPNQAISEINFYQNLVRIKEVTNASLISPFNTTAILSYKFKLISTDTLDQKLIYKIKVTPRKIGNSTLRGYVEIVDQIWKIQR